MTATADQQLFSIAAGCEEDRHAHRNGATRNCGADSIVEDLLIDVEDGRIVIVARRPTAFIGSPEMLDLGDVTLLPGLIDIHQLLAFDASDDPWPTCSMLMTPPCCCGLRPFAPVSSCVGQHARRPGASPAGNIQLN